MREGGRDERERMWEGRERGDTYVFEVIHDIIEKLRLLEIISHVLDGVLGDQILRDLRPHLLFLVLLPDVASSGLHPFHLPRRHQFCTSSVLVFFRNEFTPSNAVVALPCDLFLSATNTFHLYPFGTGWDVDDGPVFVGAVVAFTEVGPLDGAGVVIVGFLGDVEFVPGAVWCTAAGLEAGGATTARPLVFVAATLTAIAISLSFGDDEVFIVMAAVA